jgi:hypothetical protein
MWVALQKLMGLCKGKALLVESRTLLQTDKESSENLWTLQGQRHGEWNKFVKCRILLDYFATTAVPDFF